MRYKIELAYKGTNYHGWQRQPNAITVQQVIEDAINLIFQLNIEIVGCGRTDTGVHAKYYVAHLDTNYVFTESDVKKLNRFLPEDIAIKSLELAKDNFHARFDAISRTYQYVISVEKNPFDTQYSWFLPNCPDVNKMNLAAKKLLEYEDFTSFSKLHTDVKTNNCKITEAFFLSQNSEIVFTISADRFLRNMVRAIVGTLIDVGRGKLNIDEFCNIIESKNRCDAGQSVPGKGLFLVNVVYPEK